MSDPMALSLYAYRCDEDATEAWKSGDYEYAGYLRSEASKARARMAEIETQTRQAQEAVKGRSAGERRGWSTNKSRKVRIFGFHSRGISRTCT